MRASVERFLERLNGWTFGVRRPRRDGANRGLRRLRRVQRLRDYVAETARFVWETLRTDGEAPEVAAAPVGGTALLTLGSGNGRRSSGAKTPSVALTFNDVWTFRSPRLVVVNGSCESVRSWLDVYELTLTRLLAARGTRNFGRDVAKAGLSAHFASEPNPDWKVATKLADGVYFERRPKPEFLRENLVRLAAVAGFALDDWRFECVDVKQRGRS